MTDEPENLTLRSLKRLDEKLDRMDGRLGELTHRVNDVYGAVTAIRRDQAQDAEIVVVDMVEQGLDRATQEALIARLRRAPGQAQQADPRHPLSRRAGLRGGRHLSRLSRRAGADRRHDRMAAAGGVMGRGDSGGVRYCVPVIKRLGALV